MKRLILSLLILYQIGEIIQLLNLQETIAEKLSISPTIQIGIGVVWLVVFAASMIQQRIMYGVVGFLIYRLTRLLFFAEAEYDRQRLPFLVVLTVLIVISFVFVRLWWTQRDGEIT